MATIGELFVNLNADTSNFDSGMSRASGSANTFGGVMGRIGQQVASFMIYDVGKKLVAGFVNATKAGIEYNATLENSQIAWTTLLGSQEKANKMLKDIEKFAATTPFEKMGVDNMAKQLNNAGFEGDALFEQLTKFGDMGGAFGVQQSSLEEMVRQYSQVKQAGVAYTEDLNILQDRGIPIYKAIASELGINVSEVKKWASEGKISADIYQNALDGVAKSVEGGMAKQSQSFSGMTSTLKDNFNAMAGVLAKPIFDFLKQGLQSVLPFMDKVSASLSEGGLMGTIQRFAPGITPFIDMAMNIFKTMGDTVGQIVQSMSAFWNEHGAMITNIVKVAWLFISTFISMTITAIGNVVSSGLAIIDGIINLFQNLFKGNFQGCWESIKQIFSNAITFVLNLMQVMFAFNLPSLIKSFGTNAMATFSSMWSSIKGFFSGGISNCLSFISNLVSQGLSNFNTMRTFGANAFSALWQTASSMMSNLLRAVVQNISQVPSTIMSFMNQAINSLRSINLFSIGSSMIKGLINGIKSMAGAVVDAAKGVVDGAINGAKKLLGINSPSRVFMEFGKFTGEGLAIGIDKEGKNVANASKGLAGSVIGGYNANLKGIKTNSNNSAQSHIQSSENEQSTPIIINIDGRKVFEVMSPYMGRASRGW